MIVFCSENTNEPMELISVSYVGEDKIELRYRCIGCKKEVAIQLDKKMVLYRGIENL